MKNLKDGNTIKFIPKARKTNKEQSVTNKKAKVIELSEFKKESKNLNANYENLLVQTARIIFNSQINLDYKYSYNIDNEFDKILKSIGSHEHNDNYIQRQQRIYTKHVADNLKKLNILGINEIFSVKDSTAINDNSKLESLIKQFDLIKDELFTLCKTKISVDLNILISKKMTNYVAVIMFVDLYEEFCKQMDNNTNSIKECDRLQNHYNHTKSDFLYKLKEIENI